MIRCFKDQSEHELKPPDNFFISQDHLSLFSTWLSSLLDEMLKEQKVQGTLWSPSTVVARLGQRIQNNESICYWAARNKIPIFCPDLTIGIIGDGIYSQSLCNQGLVIDIIGDLRRINSMAMKAINSGIISVGAGVVKHHICKANCIRDGADYAVYLNMAQAFDGSDSGAEPDESVACGKIKIGANPAKIHGDPSLIFPLLFSETFVKHLNHKKVL